MKIRPVLSLLLSLGSVQALQHLQRFADSSQAKCIDGSPAGYYFEAGKEATRWVVWIEGGGICETNTDCYQRSLTALGSSKEWPAEREGTQQQQTTKLGNEDFYDWNMVYIPYCSGDMWVGMETNRSDPFANASRTHLWAFGGQRYFDDSDAAEDSQFEFYFTGHLILEAVITDLKANRAMTNATDVLLTGCSAGGIGTFHNIDWLASQFDAAKTKVVGNPMAGYFGVAVPTYEEWVEGRPDPDPYNLRASAWFLQLRRPPYTAPAVRACMQAHHATQQLCMVVTMFYPFTKAALFVSENTADSYQIFYQGGCPALPWVGTDAADQFVELFRSKMAQALASQVALGPKNRTDGLFAPPCLAHCLMWNAPWAPRVAGADHQRAVGDWYFGRGSSQMRLSTDSSLKQLLSCTDVAADLSSQDRLSPHQPHNIAVA